MHSEHAMHKGDVWSVQITQKPLYATSWKNPGAKMIFICVTSTTLKTLRVALLIQGVM